MLRVGVSCGVALGVDKGNGHAWFSAIYNRLERCHGLKKGRSTCEQVTPAGPVSGDGRIQAEHRKDEKDRKADFLKIELAFGRLMTRFFLQSLAVSKLAHRHNLI
jgi:hypothetical protein